MVVGFEEKNCSGLLIILNPPLIPNRCKYKLTNLMAVSNGHCCCVIQIHLFQAWATTGRLSKDDWVEWLRRLGVELLKESPNPALRSCWALAQAYNSLSRYFD